MIDGIDRVTYLYAALPVKPRRFPDGEINPTLAFDGCYTMYELFRRSVAIWPNRPFLGHRPIDSEVRAVSCLWSLERTDRHTYTPSSPH